jgi:cell wall-associated NlpC family hydrolase
VPRKPFSRLHPRARIAGLVLAAGLGACSAAWGAPDNALPEAPQDAVSRFLAERGQLDSAAQKGSSLVRQVRESASDLVVSAMTFLGVRYRRGGNSAEEGFDCSGFTRHVFESSLGLVLPRRADEQAKAPGWFAVKRDELKPGDLVFFNTLRRTFSHVGIYVGEGKFIHAPRSGSEVRIEDMRESYWAKRFTGARRTPLATTEALPALSATAPAADTAAQPRTAGVRPQHAD